MSKNILITGASTGIGAACAEALAKNNTIIVHYNQSQTAAESVCEAIKTGGGEALSFQADVSTEQGCQSLCNYAAQQCGKLDVLINNAGGLIKRGPAVDLNWTLVDDIFKLNVYSVFEITAGCIPLLEKGEAPCIVNMTSIAQRHGAATATAYGASKAAIDSFTRGLAKELAPKIRVNAVAPGIIATPFHDKVSTPEWMEEMKTKTPLGRNGEVADITSAVNMLIDNTFITGETIDVNGGLFMR